MLIQQQYISGNALVNIKLLNSEQHLKCVLFDEVHRGAQIFKYFCLLVCSLRYLCSNLFITTRFHLTNVFILTHISLG